MLNTTVLKLNIYINSPFLSMFVKYLAYILFQSENISREMDAIKFISFNQIKIVILLVKKKHKTCSRVCRSAIMWVKMEV